MMVEPQPKMPVYMMDLKNEICKGDQENFHYIPDQTRLPFGCS